MAKALSHLMSIIRGSVGGITYTANQFAQIVLRQRTAPVQPGTPLQTLVKTAFSAASQAWRDMTQLQRDSWDVYAHTCIYTGPTGTYTIPGRSIFMSGYALATYLNSGGYAINVPVLTPPLQTGFAVLGDIKTLDPAVPGVGFDLSIVNPNPSELSCLLSLSLGFDQSRNFYKGPWDDTMTAGVSIPASSSVLVPYTGLEDGLKYFLRLKGVITNGPHRTTSEFFTAAIAATNP